MGTDEKHEWTDDDIETLFNSQSRIIHNQKQIIKGIVALAKKEGLEISFKDDDGTVTFEGDPKED